MRHYNGWLWYQLKENYGDRVSRNYDPLIHITKLGADGVTHLHKIWCPTPEDYRITRDCVEEVQEIGGTFISYASAWSMPSEEGYEAARQLGITIKPHGQTIAFFR